jgi:hypothetical protein
MHNYSRCFNAFKVVTEKKMVVKLPMHHVRVDLLKFTNISYSKMGAEIILEFERLPDAPAPDAYNKFKEEMRLKHSNEGSGGPYLY